MARVTGQLIAQGTAAGLGAAVSGGSMAGAAMGFNIDKNIHPTEEELRNRILNQLRWRGTTNTVALIWHGYLSALLEWGLIEVDVYGNLSELLPKVGSKELYELFSDEPLTLEQEREIDKFLSQRTQK